MNPSDFKVNQTDNTFFALFDKGTGTSHGPTMWLGALTPTGGVPPVIFSKNQFNYSF